MAEPKLKHCTVREGDSEWHLECRFSDGQKYAAIKIDEACPELATRVAALLNGNVWTDERPTEPGEYWLSIQPAKRAGRYDFPKVIPCDVSMCANAYLMDIGSLALGGDKAGCTLAVRYITGGIWIPINDAWFDGAKWSRRETPADPFAQTSSMRTDQDGREYNHYDREQKLNPDALVKKAIQYLRKRKPKNGRGYVYPLWKRVADLFGNGSGYSAEICRRYGFDPDEQWMPEQQCPAFAECATRIDTCT